MFSFTMDSGIKDITHVKLRDSKSMFKFGLHIRSVDAFDRTTLTFIVLIKMFNALDVNISTLPNNKK